MFGPEIYTLRRTQLLEKVTGGLILLLGNEDVGMNYKANLYHFRQDSTFLYFFGIQIPGMLAILDVDSGAVHLFGNDPTLDDMVWTGPQPMMKDWGIRCGVTKTGSYQQGVEMLQKAKEQDRAIHYLPPYRAHNRRFIHEHAGVALSAVDSSASESLVRAVIALRSIKTAAEIVEMEKALSTTREMHLAMMRGAKPGLAEMELTGQIEGIAASGGGGLAYPAILSINGQVLHNHHHDQIMQEGDLLLGDFGAQSSSCYAGDITRTVPVSSKFTETQKKIYQLVLDAEMEAIESCLPGNSFQDIHLQAAKTMTSGLINMGLMKGDSAEAVAAGAHAMFFPHGLGHMIGLDVHDMEDLGEDLVGYDDEYKRIDQFGTAYLRLGKKLETGNVVTVEPGLYFIPELIDQWQAEGKFTEFINYEKVNQFRDFGGIRIEDNILITENGPKVLGPAIPKTVEEIEEMRV